MKKFLILIFLAWTGLAKGQDANTDYQSFRKDLLDDYQKYRKGVLDDYADYLAGIWKEFQLFRGVKRDETPKPVTVPNVEDIPTNPVPQELPAPNVIPKEEPQVPEVAPVSKPNEPAKPINAPTLDFTFYGVQLRSIKLNVLHLSSLEPSAISNIWRQYQKSNPKEVINSLASLSQLYGLNNWFTTELVRRYVDTLLRNGSSSDRIVLQHFLLSNLGFDIRLASTQRQLLLLVPCKQQMYERSFLNIDGQKYYVFYDNISPIKENSIAIYTCNLPHDVYKGDFVDLVYKQQSLTLKSGNDKKCTLTDGRISVSGNVNSGMMEMLRHYPLMDVPYYAASKVMPAFHKDVLEQIKPQILGMTQEQAANALLHFVQYAFDYATDGEQHGYEKPYFLEENFYYPKNDCEDRSILYAFLVHNLLGLDVHLVQYPGHECTAVNFGNQSVDGDGYLYNEKVFIICDPTYIGASIGQCMPSYQNIQPIVEEWY